MLVDKSKIRNYWNKRPLGTLDIDFSPETKGFFLEHERRYADEIKFMEFSPSELKGSLTLDAGCGVGFWVRKLAKEHVKVIGLDLSDESVKITKNSLEIFGLSAYILVGDVENLPFKSNVFDNVISFGVLHHTPNTEKGINEIYRVLKPGGKAFLSFYYKNFLLRKPMF